MKASDSTHALSVRAVAARLYCRVVAGETLESTLDVDQGLSDRDQSLLRALVAGALRWHFRLDWQLSRLSSRPVATLDPLVAALLRLGLYQLQMMRIPDHAAVSATVDATQELGLNRVRGLVNAVLRRFLRERDILDAALATNEVARYSHPAWLIDALRADWPDQWDAVLAANNVQAPMWLRVNRQRLSCDAYLQLLQQAGSIASGVAGLPAALLMDRPTAAENLPGYDDGLVSIQDGAAQRVEALMTLAPGLRVLDACAAPGGKSALMLESCPGLAELVAVDKSDSRLAQVRGNLSRLGLGATLVCGDARDPHAWWDGAFFDRILVDAPCTAIGVIRRHPEIKLLRRAGDVDALACTQRELLRALWPLLRPGGTLVYSTCSVLRCENLGVVERFVAGRPGVECAPFGTAKHFQVLPGDANMDGFYYACLTKSRER